MEIMFANARPGHQAFSFKNHLREPRQPRGGDSPSDESRLDRVAVNRSNCDSFQLRITSPWNRSSCKSFQTVMPAPIDFSPKRPNRVHSSAGWRSDPRKARPAENGRACEFEFERYQSARDQGQKPHAASMNPRSAPVTAPSPLKSAEPASPNWASRRPMSPPLTTASPFRSATQTSTSSHSTPP